MKHPKITVYATPELLRELLLVERALKVSRMDGTKSTPEVHSLIVQVMVARRGLEPVLEAPPARAAERFDPPPIESHPDYCHQHGGHLRDSPACLLAQSQPGSDG